MSTLVTPPAASRRRSRFARRDAGLAPALGVLPFLAYLTVFLIAPTLAVVAGAFQEDGRFTTANLRALGEPAVRDALVGSLVLSAASALISGVAGAAIAWAIAGLSPTNALRRVVLALSSALAQTGGVSLAFAWMATVGLGGTLQVLLADHLGVDIAGSGWLFTLRGLILVYCYFQIPLMVIVFTPALEGLRPQWREAAQSLGASGADYFRLVVVPLLRPAFLGALVLLFADAFAAYATAAALVSQGSPILPLMIRAGLTSEVVLGREHVAYAMALEMVVVVSLVMFVYGRLLRRSARWIR